MSFFPLPVQAQTFYLAGSGAIIGATSIVLKSFQTIDGADLLTADFGSAGYLTIDAGNSTLEEQISFTGVVQNANGTATLTGVKSVLFTTPWTETSGLVKTHAGSAPVVISNTSGFYAQIKNYIDTAVVSGAVPSTTTTLGIGKLSTAAVDPSNPVFVGTNDTRMPTQDENNALVGTGTPSSSNVYVTADYQQFSPPGIISPYSGRSAPTGWLLCDGTAVSRTTYSTLASIILPSGTVTVTIATPGVFTKTSHGLVVGDIVTFTTTGALPTGLAVNTNYFVITAGLTANEFQVSATRAGAAVDTSGTQSGVHTLFISNYGKGDGSTTFNVPDMRGFTTFGYKSSDANFDVLNVPNTYVGEKTHQLITAELAAHAHPLSPGYRPQTGGSTGPAGSSSTWAGVVTSTDSVGSDTPHNNMPPYVVVNYIIKT